MFIQQLTVTVLDADNLTELLGKKKRITLLNKVILFTARVFHTHYQTEVPDPKISYSTSKANFIKNT
jgi:hypothetical protein